MSPKTIRLTPAEPLGRVTRASEVLHSGESVTAVRYMMVSNCSLNAPFNFLCHKYVFNGNVCVIFMVHLELQFL